METINQKQWNFLEKTEKNNSLVSVYLFCGPSKIGKNTMAFDFVRKINNLEEKTNIEDGANPDVIVVAPKTEEKAKKKRKKDISIEQVKEAIKSVGYYPYKAKYKVLIIKEADRMTASAANSLLKIMEEPTSDTIIILVSDNDLRLLSTIRSRCQIIRFGLASKAVISKQLQYENVEFEEEELEEVVEFSQGKIVKAREFLTNPDKLKGQFKKFQKCSQKRSTRGLYALR